MTDDGSPTACAFTHAHFAIRHPASGIRQDLDALLNIR